MFGIGVCWEGKTDPGVEREIVVSELNFSSFGWGIKFIVVNTGPLNTLKAHGHKFTVGTEGDCGNGLAVIGACIIRLGFLFLFGIINHPIIAGDVKHTVRWH